MAESYIPHKNTAQFRSYTGNTYNDPKVYTEENPFIPSSKYFYNQVQSEILNLIDLSLQGGTALKIINQTGNTLQSGSLLFIDGFHQQQQAFKVNLATNLSEVRQALLITSGILPNNTVGIGFPFQAVAGFNTASNSLGQPVYLDTSGNWTLTQPTNPNSYVQQVGVVSSLHSGLGSIAFFPGNRWTQKKPYNGLQSSVKIQVNGVDIGTRKILNFLLNSGASIFAQDNESGNRVDITLSGGGSASVSAPLTLTGTSDTKQLVVKGHSSQTANVFEVQASDGTAKVWAKAGLIGLGNDSSTRSLEIGNNAIALTSVGSLMFAPASSYGNEGDIQNVADTSIRRAKPSWIKVTDNSTAYGGIVLSGLNTIGDSVLSGRTYAQRIHGNWPELHDNLATKHYVDSSILSGGSPGGSYVDLTTGQTVSGAKTFHNAKTAGNPIAVNDVANKGYIDSGLQTLIIFEPASYTPGVIATNEGSFDTFNGNPAIKLHNYASSDSNVVFKGTMPNNHTSGARILATVAYVVSGASAGLGRFDFKWERQRPGINLKTSQFTSFSDYRYFGANGNGILNYTTFEFPPQTYQYIQPGEQFRLQLEATSNTSDANVTITLPVWITSIRFSKKIE